MIRIGARNSPLARTQAAMVADALAGHGLESEFVPIQSQGDVDRRELTQIGGTGVFAAAVRDRLLDNSIDLAVHSLKDLPTAAVDGLEIAAYPAREDTRDVLVGSVELTTAVATESSRPLVVGTGSPRRAVQLQQSADECGRELIIRPIRGNVDTRLQQVRDGRFDLTVLAAAGLRRLGRLDANAAGELRVADLPARVLPYHELLPAPGQGALAIETSTALDSKIRNVLTRLDDAATRAEVLAERRFLAVLEAGCTAPVGARAWVGSAPAGGEKTAVRDAGTDLTLVAVIGRTRGDDPRPFGRTDLDGRTFDDVPDGQVVNRGRLVTLTGQGRRDDPAALGERLAELALQVVDPSEFA